MPIIYDFEQGSEEWKNIRCGIVTGSNVGKIMKKPNAKHANDYYATRKNYMAELACEIITGKPYEMDFKSNAMERGNEMEAPAWDAYEFETRRDTHVVGFVKLNEEDRHGSSPDRLIGVDGYGESKCPNTSTHFGYLMTGEIGRDYMYQVQTGLMHTGRQWADWISFDDRAPQAIELYIKRIPRDDVMIAEIKFEIEKFLGELDILVDQLKSRMGI